MGDKPLPFNIEEIAHPKRRFTRDSAEFVQLESIVRSMNEEGGQASALMQSGCGYTFEDKAALLLISEGKIPKPVAFTTCAGCLKLALARFEYVRSAIQDILAIAEKPE